MIRARRAAENGAVSLADLYAAIMEGAVERVRPKMMTVVAIMAGLLPIMWGSGTGSEVMSRVAAPMLGGMISAPLLALFIVPAAYALLRRPRGAAAVGTAAIRVFGHVRIDTDSHEVTVAGEVVKLTRIEYALLDRLSVNPRVAVSRSDLMVAVLGDKGRHTRAAVGVGGDGHGDGAVSMTFLPPRPRPEPAAAVQILTL